MTFAMPVQCSHQLSYGSHLDLVRSTCWPYVFPSNEWWVKEMCGWEMNWRNDPHTCRGHGFESRWRRLKFFRQSLRLSSNCEDHFLNSSLKHTSVKYFFHNNDCVAMSQVWTRINIGTLPQMVGPGSGLSLSSPVPMLLLRPFRTCSGVQSPRWLCCFHQLAWFRPENKTQTYFDPYMPCLYACKIQENSMKVTTFTSWFTRLSMKHFASAVIFDCDS